MSRPVAFGLALAVASGVFTSSAVFGLPGDVVNQVGRGTQFSAAAVPINHPAETSAGEAAGRITYGTVTRWASIPFATQNQSDPTLPLGSSIVAKTGADGIEAITYTVTYLDGVVVSEVVASRVVRSEPQPKVVRVGTGVATVSRSVSLTKTPVPSKFVAPTAFPSVASSSPASAKAIPPAPTRSTTSSSGVASLNWDAVAQCESGGNWADNTGNGYYGGLQFGTPTWISNGGGTYAARADLATKAQQIEIATNLYVARGAAPWPTCGKYL